MSLVRVLRLHALPMEVCLLTLLGELSGRHTHIGRSATSHSWMHVHGRGPNHRVVHRLGRHMTLLLPRRSHPALHHGWVTLLVWTTCHSIGWLALVKALLRMVHHAASTVAAVWRHRSHVVMLLWGKTRFKSLRSLRCHHAALIIALRWTHIGWWITLLHHHR